jgi:phosphodiesterase/alkaline phosphatase D-like protein
MTDRILLGPVLRRVADGYASIWVQTDSPATVEVRAGSAGGSARTFAAFGYHFALVVVSGLEPDTATPYQVLLDGEVAWPRPDDTYPAPVIRTGVPGDRPVRVVFGSCREASPYAVSHYPPDALDAYATRLAAEVHERGAAATHWPDLLLLLGDQVYADVISSETKSWIKRRRRRRRYPEAPETQVIDFAEYTRLYLESWTDPDVRWLLSTVPSCMIFDDHEVIDDWNTSASWREDMAAKPWWRVRIVSGLASYWVYQHLGNLDPRQVAADPVYARVTAAADATRILEEFGQRADTEPGSYRWSYALDVGDTRVVVVDNRCGRQLEPGKRSMLSEADWDWLARTAAEDGYRHLVIGSSLPWLMPPGLHHLEAWNEARCESPNPRTAAVAERIRRGADLEHWPAFNRSFRAMADLLRQLASGAAGRTAPATVNVLSGDVHHSYVARADLGPDARTPVHQLVCSPVHNRVPSPLRPLLKLGWGGAGVRATRRMARSAGAAAPGMSWRRVSGPYFGNAIGSLVFAGGGASVVVEGTDREGVLSPVVSAELA